MMITTWKTSSAASCRLSRMRLALGAAGEDARRTAAGTAALLSVLKQYKSCGHGTRRTLYETLFPVKRLRVSSGYCEIGEVPIDLQAASFLTSKVSGLEQTARSLPNRMVWFPLDAPSSQAGARKPRGLDIGIGSRIKSQAKFQTAARRESSEDSMKRAFLLIVVPALLVALGFAQTPAASTNTDQTNIKGCLGGADGNYTVVQDNTGHTFKITTSGVDLKAHLGHDVSLIGHRASGTSSAAADNSFAVAELTMISEHCAAAAAAPVATTTSTLPETAIKPVAPATAPAATVTATSE